MSLSEPPTAAESFARAQDVRRRLMGQRPRIEREHPVWPVGKFHLPKRSPSAAYRLCDWLTCSPISTDANARHESPMATPYASMQDKAVSEIIRAACCYCDVDIADFFSGRLYAPLGIARAVVAHLACSLTNLSTPRIGYLMGGRDHTTVLHHRDRMRAILKREAAGDNLSTKERFKCDAVATVRAEVLKEM